MNRLNFLLSRECGPAFLEAFVKQTAEVFAADRVYIARIDATHSRMRTLKVACGNAMVGNYCYELKGTPCSDVMDAGADIFEDNVSTRFPRDFMLEEMGMRAYVGMPLYNGAQSVGIVVAMFKRPADVADDPAEAVLRAELGLSPAYGSRLSLSSDLSSSTSPGGRPAAGSWFSPRWARARRVC